jgi:predicted acylesterase/phospholipase RssA
MSSRWPTSRLLSPLATDTAPESADQSAGGVAHMNKMALVLQGEGALGAYEQGVVAN